MSVASTPKSGGFQHRGGPNPSLEGTNKLSLVSFKNKEIFLLHLNLFSVIQSPKNHKESIKLPLNSPRDEKQLLQRR